MQINVTLIRVGNILDLDGELYRVTWTAHRSLGRGGASIQARFKHVITGKNLEKKFNSSDRVEKASLESKGMQYLYQEESGFVFMDNENFEQTTLATDFVGDSAPLLAEGEVYEINFYDETPVGIDFPKSMTFKVTFAPPDLKKATATASLKPIELENGMTINAPGFIKEGDVVKINTETMEYLERA